uniref:Oligopeptide transporter 4 n=1 Tax=Aegilops tauschii subsp. strangulata TaxID=200361 RepID=A0A453QPE4_AEGTS
GGRARAGGRRQGAVDGAGGVGDVPGGGGAADGARRRRPDAAGVDVPDVGHRAAVLRAHELPQPVLLLPDGAAGGDPDHGAGGVAARGPLPGPRAAPPQVPRRRPGVEPQPGALQHEGARAHLHLRQRRLRLRQRQRLLGDDRGHHPRLLPPLHLLPRRMDPHHHHPGSWVRVGGADAQVRGGAGAHVVAQHARPGLALQVSMTLHEKEEFTGGSRQMSRSKFFLVVLICSFVWAFVPGYLFQSLTSISWVCWVFSKSVTAQQLGSGMKGLGLGAFTLDWTAVSSFLFSPLISPFFATVNVLVGYVLFIYVVMPTAYWGMNLYNAKTFPIFSSHLFASNGSPYKIADIVNQQFQLDTEAYDKLGRINLSIFFAISYGFNFATIAATITHVGFFYGKEIYHRFRASQQEEPDVHTKLMRKYEDIPAWWFYSVTALSMIVSLILCTVLKDQVQLPWWGFLFACAMAFTFTLPVSIISATTNQTPGLNVITEYVMGLIMPGYPIANVCFKVYGYISMSQAISFLADFKLGHYMKIPPKSMFIVQFVGTVVAGTVNLIVGWWLLGSVENICQDQLLPPNSPWTCPNDRVFFDASVIWGLVGPNRIFGSNGNYIALNWFFLFGAAGPVIVYILHRIFPTHKWILLINIPVLTGATALMPPASTLNFNSWLLYGIIFNFFVFRYRKKWWQRYNYILSAGLDAGAAFMGVLLYFTLTMENRTIKWWGTGGEHCPLASCPTAKGVDLGPDSVCPVF